MIVSPVGEHLVQESDDFVQLKWRHEGGGNA